MKIRQYVGCALYWLCIIYDCETPSGFLWKIRRIMEKLSRGGNKTDASQVWG